MKRRARIGRRGSVAVEFAMVSLAMLTWIFGMMEVARAYWIYQIMDEVAIEGARCMGVVAASCASGGVYSSSAATSFITNLASARGMTITAANVTLARPAACANTAGFSKVTINYIFTGTAPKLIPALESLVLSANACFYNVK